MLKQNGHLQNQLPLRMMGGGTISGNRANFGRGDLKGWYCGDHAPDTKSARPSGYLAGGAWMLPMKAGGMAAYSGVSGSGALSGTGQAGLNASANLTGTGDITSAVASLIVAMLASISGSGTISNADVKAFLSMLASISGSGGISSAPLKGLGELIASLSGSGTASGSTITGLGAMGASIRGYGDLTPEGIRDSVWNALAASYNTSGTMGQKLNSAASGGVDYNALAAAVWQYIIESGISAEQAMRIYGAVLAGKVSGAGTGTEVFTGLDGTTVRVTSTVDASGNRTAVTVDGA